MTPDDFCHNTFMAFEMSHFGILLMGVDLVALLGPNMFSVREGFQKANGC